MNIFFFQEQKIIHNTVKTRVKVVSWNIMYTKELYINDRMINAQCDDGPWPLI